MAASQRSRRQMARQHSWSERKAAAFEMKLRSIRESVRPFFARRGSMFSPDTVVVISKSVAHTDYTPLFSGIAASALVAGMAWYSTRAQRKIAEDATATQRHLGEAAIVAQREIARESVGTQLEIARKANVVAARREWMHDLRAAVSQFVGSAQAIHNLARAPIMDVAGIQESRSRQSELFRYLSSIRLLLDPKKPTHLTVANAARIVGEWAYLGDSGVESGNPLTNEAVAAARSYPSFQSALGALDSAVSVLLEDAWGRIRKGE